MENNAKVIRENSEQAVLQLPSGEFIKKPKYKEMNTFKPGNRAAAIWLLNLLEGVENVATPMSEAVGEIIEVKSVITKPYETVDSVSGLPLFGVLTYLITPENKAYVTSAKMVYHTVQRLVDVFGLPGSKRWKDIYVAITAIEMVNGDAINIKLVEGKEDIDS